LHEWKLMHAYSIYPALQLPFLASILIFSAPQWRIEI
jgi:hypothetical protein